MATSDCQVCCNSYNKTTRKPVQCFKCNYNACVACWKTYILGSVNDAQCMNCHELWTPEFMDETFSKYWRTGDYKERRMQILLDRERAQFPATIQAVEDERRRRQLRKELADIQRRMQALRAEENRIYVELGRAPRQREEIAQPKILCKCPATSCQGFVLSANSKCAACDTEVCKDCFAIKKDADGAGGSGEHVCKPDDIATAKLIQKECKPCPGCAVLIHRWTGCPMMFCTSCNTAFDWRTLEKITHKNIHNPHYVEYLARQRTNDSNANANNTADMNCAGLPGFYQVSDHLSSGVRNSVTKVFVPYYTQAERQRILEQLRVIAHIQDIEMPRYNPNERIPQNNEDLRVSFMMNEITEEMFKAQIIEREQKREKLRATYEILDMYVRVGTDFIRRILLTPSKDRQTVLKISDEINALNKYLGECFDKQTKRFGSLRKPNFDRLMVYGRI